MLAKSLARSTSVPAGEAIDRRHLASATLGDKGLEREVLHLFDRQSELLLGRLRDAPAAAILILAHTLEGSARGIGAWRVAAAAEALAEAARHDAGGVATATRQLATAIGEARTAIATLL